jgi:hypothetical protein
MVLSVEGVECQQNDAAPLPAALVPAPLRLVLMLEGVECECDNVSRTKG